MSALGGRRRSPRLLAKQKQLQSRIAQPKDEELKQSHTDVTSGGGMERLIVRCLAGSLMIAAFFFLCYVSIWGPVFIAFIVQVVSFKELMEIRYPSVGALSWLTFAFGLWATHGTFVVSWISAAGGSWAEKLMRYHMILFVGGVLTCLVLFIYQLEKHCLDLRREIEKLAWMCLSLFLIIGQGAGTMWVLERGIIWFMLPISVTVCNDIMALFCGLAFGRKFFKAGFLSLSPKKTWEGYLFSIPLTLLFGFIFVRLCILVDFWVCPMEAMDSTSQCVHPVSDQPFYLHGLVFALFSSTVSPFAGFLASAIKRAHNRKDFGSLIPGHGGMFDRMDAIYCTQFFTYGYLKTFVF